MNPTHTPTLPLTFKNGNVIDAKGVPFMGTDSNWRSVVRAVNAHDEMILRLKAWTRLYSDMHAHTDEGNEGCIVCESEKTIAKAEGK